MRNYWRFQWIGILFVVSSFAGDFPSPAPRRQEGALRNFDVRRNTSTEKRRLAPSSVPRLTSRPRDAGTLVDADEVTMTPKFVRDVDGLLTIPSDEPGAAEEESTGIAPDTNPHSIVSRYLDSHSDRFGHGGEVLKSARVVRDYTSSASGMRVIAWQQYLRGIAVFEGTLSASITEAGALVSVSSQFLPNAARAAATGPEKRQTIDVVPRISAREAASAAFRSLGESFEARRFSTSRPQRNDWAAKQTLARTGSRETISAELVWLPIARNRMRLCWRLILHDKAGNVFQVLVDGETGEPQVRHAWSHGVAPAVFRVFTSDSPSPFSPGHTQATATNQPLNISTPLPEFTNQVDLTITTNAASPNGWVNDSAAFNFQLTTIGNNVDAHLDILDHDPAYDQPITAPPEARPPGTLTNGALRFLFTADLGQPAFTTTNVPATTNQMAAVVNAFYWCNWMHDRLWEFGFTEAAGNFQYDNFGRGGLGGDPVLMDVQNRVALGSHNVGFFSCSPLDGNPARISLGVWNGPSPHREGAFDAEILLHEYVHLLTTRRVGHGVGLSSEQALGLAEGWSDFLALCLLSQPGDDLGGAFAYGAFSTYRWTFNGVTLMQNYHYGMRRYPYSTNMSRNPLTFNDLDWEDATGHLAVAVSPLFAPYQPFGIATEAHYMGEVWAVTLWDFFANAVQKHGFVSGKETVLKIVLDGMSLCPANPTFLQARDALLLADRALTGGANWNDLWRAFAKRGMGWSAPEPVFAGTPRVTPAFDMPPTGQLLPGWPFVARNAIHSSPALATNAVYFGSNDGRLYSLSPNATTNWCFIPARPAAAFVSSPVVAPDGTVYAKRKNGWFYALRPDGTVKWSNRLDAVSYASPAVGSDGTVYVVGNRDLLALHPNGTQKWKFMASRTINSSPSVGADGTLYFGSADGRLYAVEPATGTLRSGWPFNAGRPIFSSPAISTNGTIYFGCANRKVYALNGATGAKLWEYTTGGVVESSPSLDAHGTVYVASQDRRVYALRASDGQLKWSFQTGAIVRSSPAAAADGTVYVGSNDGNLYALSSASGQLVYSYRLGGIVYSSPVISPEGNVYVGSGNGKIIGLRGLAGPAKSGWPMFRRDSRRRANVGLQ
jgi:outer membrane protein assembly factor BamB